jgi:hypothetical protein
VVVFDPAFTRGFIISNLYQMLLSNRNSSVGVWRATDWTPGARFPVVARKFSLLHNFQSRSGVHPVSYPKNSKGC